MRMRTPVERMGRALTRDDHVGRPCDICGCMGYENEQRVALIRYEPPRAPGCKSCMITIERLNKYRDKTQELQGSLNAHKQTISQLLQQISEMRSSESIVEKSRRQEALLVKQMQALKKSLAREANSRTALREIEGRLFQAETEKQNNRRLLHDMKSCLKKKTDDVARLNRRVQELEESSDHLVRYQSLQNENQALVLEVQTKNEELNRLQEYIAERERTDAEMFKQLAGEIPTSETERSGVTESFLGKANISIDEEQMSVKTETVEKEVWMERRSTSRVADMRSADRSSPEFESELLSKLTQNGTSIGSAQHMTTTDARQAERNYERRQHLNGVRLSRTGGESDLDSSRFSEHEERTIHERLRQALMEGSMSEDETEFDKRAGSGVGGSPSR